jgi:hypothetical protein
MKQWTREQIMKGLQELVTEIYIVFSFKVSLRYFLYFSNRLIILRF